MRTDPLTTLSAAPSVFHREEVVWFFMDALNGATLSNDSKDIVPHLTRGSFILVTLSSQRNALCTHSIWAMLPQFCQNCPNVAVQILVQSVPHSGKKN